MKLHNLSVIFIVIAIPIILIVSYYISLQIDTINMQTAYNAKLLDSTKTAIEAFEINTVQWNPSYSQTADSKRRDIMASINTFTSSFANNIGVGGTSKEYILAHIPALAYTLYDGYYIYSPADAKVIITDDNGVRKLMNKELADSIGYASYKPEDDGKILYEYAGIDKVGGSPDGSINTNKNGKTETVQFTLDPSKAATEYKHILKPFAAYSEKLGDMVINYTLDNYVTIYGEVENKKTGKTEYVSKAGYLTAEGDITGVVNNKITGIKFRNNEIKPEKNLYEQIAYKTNSSSSVQKGSFNYVYESNNTKVYFDNNNKPFVLDNDSVVVYVENLPKPLYKKLTIPRIIGTEISYLETYQNLLNGEWYTTSDKTNYTKIDNMSYYDGVDNELNTDYSAINYCVESYVFTEWFNSLSDLSDKIEKDEHGNCICGYKHGDCLKIKTTNDPEDEDSDFSTHKRGIIKKVIESNLNQAITSYSRKSEGEYKLPVLTETDWDQILRNVSIITFVQNIPIGLKYYNNYAIATSTVNKEYVDPNEIYLNASDGDSTYYHMPYCSHLGEEHLIGYRSIDYIQQSHKDMYYYKHHKNNLEISVEEACYYCLVQKSLYKEEDKSNTKKLEAYHIALARERYVARMAKLPQEVEPVYSIYVEAVDSNNSGVNGGFFINLDGNIIKDYTGENAKQYDIQRISESNEGKTYHIEAKADSIGVTPDEGIKDYGSLDYPKGVVEDNLTPQSPYTSNSKIDIKINRYTTNGANGIYVGYSNATNVEYGNGEHKSYTDQTGFIGPELGVGYVNVKLKYQSNYTNPADAAPIEVSANINSHDSLTIVTNLKDITGKIRLRFTNSEGAQYYSANTFDVIDKNTNIYCIVGDINKGDTSWYNGEWKVEVLNVNNDGIGTNGIGSVSYYTINTAQGLTEFANAVNGTKGPAKGAKTAGRTFKLIEDINSVGEMEPIARSCETEKKWFDGVFLGEGHTVSNINIKTENNPSYAFGLFGWVGKLAKIENLTISNINVNLSSITNKVDNKAGGLAGFCDQGEKIDNVSVNGSTIKGTAYVGGLVGENKKVINNSDITTSSVSSVGTRNIIFDNNEIYVGGIAGKSENEINNCKVLGESKIGEGNIAIDESWSYKKDQYYVGGIVGYTNATVTSPSVDSRVSVIGGAITKVAFDKFKATYTGGVIGYKETNQTINGSFNVSCNVSGHDNVGGIIGFNAGGDIDNVVFSGTITGDGQNIGGIVGANTGGKISNCTNNVSINTLGKNVGGIVGCNSNQIIESCYNNKTITGDQNVGGIVGITYNGYIKSCGNNKDAIVTGVNNTLTAAGNTPIKDIIGDSDSDGILEGLFNKISDIVNNVKTSDLLYLYNTHGSNSTGTGGITGKNYCATIECSYNNANIICNYNGGGIEGLNFNGTTKYSYNSGNITNYDHRNKQMNRLGGICGAGHGVTITKCYNIGEINGEDTTLLYPLREGTGGIAGFIVDNFTSLAVKKDEVGIPGYEIPIKYIGTNTTENNINYCYNAGDIRGGNKYNNAIVGCVGVAPTFDGKAEKIIQFIGNYYLDTTTTGDGAIGSLSELTKRMNNQNGYTSKNENDFKEQLYNWSIDKGKVAIPEKEVNAGAYVYRTTAPLEEDKGYKGYGILWWQIKDYVRLTTNVFLCDITKENGKETGKEYKAISMAYNPVVKLNENTLVFRNLPFECKVTNPFPNNKPVSCGECLRWEMMIKDKDYTVEGKTDYTEEAEYFKENNYIGRYNNINIEKGSDKVISIAPIIEVVSDKLDTKSISTVWKRKNIDIITTRNWNSWPSSLSWGLYDNNKNEIKSIRGYFEYDPNSSKQTYNDGKRVEITMDKGDKSASNQPVYLYSFEYYKNKGKDGPYLVEEGTLADDIKPSHITYKGSLKVEANADKAACNVYIPVDNLVDRIGENRARNSRLYTAKLNMEFTARLKTALLKKNISHLTAVITLERKEQGSNNWIQVDKIVQNGFTEDAKKKKPFGDDYTEFNADLEALRIKDWSLGEVNYNDEFRVNIDLLFEGTTEKAYIIINNVNLDITYGPDVK